MAKFDKRLRGILLEDKLLSDGQAEESLRIAEEQDRSLSQVVVEQGLVDERALVGAVAAAMNIPPVDLSRVEAQPEALECLPQDMATYYGVLPVAKVGSVLTMAVSNPFDILKLDDIELITGCDIRPVVSTDVAIRTAIEKSYASASEQIEELFGDFRDDLVSMNKSGEDEGEVDLSEISDDAEGSPVIKLVNLLIFQAVRDGASDIHIEPYERRLRVRYRQDGALFEALTPPKRLQNAVISRIKIMSDLDIAEKHKPQDGKFQLKIAGRPIDFRVSILPVVHGEKAVLRILDSSNLALSLDSLGFEEKALGDFRKAIHAPYGMILVTGPTGSGKSTTLYSAIKEVISVEENIVTVEDPVEYQLDGVNQVQVSTKRGLTFAGALRSILRQDPDTVLVGEVRDTETAEIAIKAALTGHRVFSTLHTNDAPSTITRLVDMDIDPFLVASSLILVSAQRLARNLCQECKEPVQVPRERLLSVGFSEQEAETATLFRAQGCPRYQNGYKGRFALLETVPMTDEVKRLVIEGASVLDIKKAALEQGMITLRRCGILNAARGVTSIEEVLNVTMGD